MKREGARFIESAANDLIEEFTMTISFANLIKSDNISGHGEDKKPQFKEEEMDTMPSNQTSGRDDSAIIPSQKFDIPIYFPSGKSGSVKIPKLTTDEWDQFISILNVYKPSVIKKTEAASEKKDQEPETEH